MRAQALQDGPDQATGAAVPAGGDTRRPEPESGTFEIEARRADRAIGRHGRAPEIERVAQRIRHADRGPRPGMDPHHVVSHRNVEQSVAVVAFGGDEGPVEAGAARAERLGACQTPSVRGAAGPSSRQRTDAPPTPRRSPPTAGSRPASSRMANASTWPSSKRANERSRAAQSASAAKRAAVPPEPGLASVDPVPAAIALSSSHIRTALSFPSSVGVLDRTRSPRRALLDCLETSPLPLRQAHKAHPAWSRHSVTTPGWRHSGSSPALHPQSETGIASTCASDCTRTDSDR